jgi:hypothetical protein
MKVLSRNKQFFIALAVFIILLAFAYLPKISHVGYLQDDWDTLFVTENRSPGELVFHYSIDRPLRGYFSLLEEKIIGTNLMLHQGSALLWRLLDATAIYLVLMLVWPKKWKINLFISALVLVYPGFHEQTNSFEYQAHLFSRMCLITSIFLSLIPYKLKKLWLKILCVLTAMVLEIISLGLMEYYIGIEVLRLALIILVSLQQQNTLRRWKTAVYAFVYLLGAAAFTYWRLFLFASRRESVDAGAMLSGYGSLSEKLLENSKALAINFYRLVVSAFYKPLTVFGEFLDRADWLLGIVLALAAAGIVAVVISRIQPVENNEENREFKPYPFALILVGLVGSLGALAPVIFGGREITYVLSGDRFSYPGSISACILIAGLLTLLKPRWLQTIAVGALIFVSVLTQFSNNVIFEKNGDQTRAAWWQLAWRAPQLKPATLLSGRIAFGTLDEDYTLWGPANLIYYPHDHDVMITAEVLSEQTLPLFIAKKQMVAERKGIEFTKDFGNLLLLSKPENACLHLLDGTHPEYSQYDDPILLQVGALSNIDQIEAGSDFKPIPRSDLFGSEPAHDWCYYYQRGQLARQQRDWQQAARLGDEALAAGFAPNDAMEWLVFLQAFAYTNDVNYIQTLQAVQKDAYASGQACKVFKSYDDEMMPSPFADSHRQLVADTCTSSD